MSDVTDAPNRNTVTRQESPTRWLKAVRTLAILEKLSRASSPPFWYYHRCHNTRAKQLSLGKTISSIRLLHAKPWKNTISPATRMNNTWYVPGTRCQELVLYYVTRCGTLCVDVLYRDVRDTAASLEDRQSECTARFLLAAVSEETLLHGRLRLI